MAEEKGVKSYELVDPKTGAAKSNLANKAPREAAIKAVGILRRGGEDFKKIVLREKGTACNGHAATIHVFEGSNVLEQLRLPLAGFRKTDVEKAAGKPIPEGVNIKGKEKELEALGFKLPMVNTGNVKKLGRYHVPKVDGKDMAGAIAEFMKTMPAPAKKA